MKDLKNFHLSDNLSVRILRAKNHVFIPLLLIFCCVLNGCGEGDDPAPGEELEPPSDNIVIDQGSIGLVVDTRAIAKKGYSPVTAQVNFSGVFSSFSNAVEIDQNTHVATLAIAAEDLTDEQVKQFADGVDATVQILDGSSEPLGEFSGSVKVDASNAPLAVETELPGIYPEVSLKEGIPYFLVADNNKLFKFARYGDNANPGGDNVDGFITLGDYDNSNAAYYHFFFKGVEGNVYNMSMWIPGVNGNNGFYLKMDHDKEGATDFALVTDYGQSPNGEERWKFEARIDEDGMIVIDPTLGSYYPLQYKSDAKLPTSLGPLGAVWQSGAEDTYTPIRLVAANVAWSATSQNTYYSAPITPAAKLDFAYQKIFRNCAPTTAFETVGKSETRTKSYTVGTEESLELYSSHEASVSVTASAEAGFSFFGAGATASVETTAGYTYTTSSTQSTTNTWQETVEESEDVSWERSVEIPPHTAVEVYDAVQTVENVKMPFVQTMRVTGSYDGSFNGITDALSGEEIASQLLFNRFGGVIVNVGNDFVDVSTKGTMTIDRFFVSETRVVELVGGCDQ